MEKAHDLSKSLHEIGSNERPASKEASSADDTKGAALSPYQGCKTYKAPEIRPPIDQNKKRKAFNSEDAEIQRPPHSHSDKRSRQESAKNAELAEALFALEEAKTEGKRREVALKPAASKKEHSKRDLTQASLKISPLEQSIKSKGTNGRPDERRASLRTNSGSEDQSVINDLKAKLELKTRECNHLQELNSSLRDSLDTTKELLAMCRPHALDSSTTKSASTLSSSRIPSIPAKSAMTRAPDLYRPGHLCYGDLCYDYCLYGKCMYPECRFIHRDLDPEQKDTLRAFRASYRHARSAY